MKLNSFKIRSSLWGTTALAITSILFCTTLGCGQDKMDTDNLGNPPPIVSEVSTTWTTTSTVTTSSTSTSATSTITTTTTEETSLRTETTIPTTETIVRTEPVYVEPVTEYIEPVYNVSGYSEDDVILLAKLINHEASTSYDGKVMVGSCVVNRMNIKGMSVSGVIFEPNQFTTAYNLTTYNDLDYQAAQQVLSRGSVDARIYFFDGCHPDRLNWFYDINHNYLGAW